MTHGDNVCQGDDMTEEQILGERAVAELVGMDFNRLRARRQRNAKHSEKDLDLAPVHHCAGRAIVYRVEDVHAWMERHPELVNSGADEGPVYTVADMLAILDCKEVKFRTMRAATRKDPDKDLAPLGEYRGRDLVFRKAEVDAWLARQDPEKLSDLAKDLRRKLPAKLRNDPPSPGDLGDAQIPPAHRYQGTAIARTVAAKVAKAKPTRKRAAERPSKLARGPKFPPKRKTSSTSKRTAG